MVITEGASFSHLSAYLICLCVEVCVSLLLLLLLLFLVTEYEYIHHTRVEKFIEWLRRSCATAMKFGMH